VKDPDYMANHRRVHKERGRAADQRCVVSDAGFHLAKEWAYIHDTDPTDPANYQPMCHVHHQVYDARWNAEERAKVAESVAKYHADMTEEERAARGARITLGKLGKKRPPVTEETRAKLRAGQSARRAREAGEA
jgi:hypothetical protein